MNMLPTHCDVRMSIVGIFAVLLFGIASDADAQLINLKTAPVATGDQFLIQPGVNEGMGTVSIALDDSLADPFVNPAKANKLQGASVFIIPTFYRVTDGLGGARTLSLGGLRSGETWFGGLGVAVQELNPAAGTSDLLKDRSSNNNYIWVQGGRRLSNSVSLGAQLSWAGLSAMDGVDLLYPRSQRIDQDGYLLDMRMGLNGETVDGAQYEAMILFNRTDMTHRVTYRQFCFIEPWFCGPEESPRVEENMDKTNTWGLHLGYNEVVGDNNWKLGSIFTLNYKTHPKIPNYELMNIPRDPGNTWAFNVGLGTSHRSEDNVTFGADVIVEPVWSNTWVEAQNNIMNPEGTRVVVKQGDKTIENEFAFVNSAIKTGVGWKGERMILQAGIAAKTYRYELKQTDYVQNTFRQQQESWTEWTFSLSTGVAFESIEIRYLGLLTAGTGQPATSRVTFGQIQNFSTTSADFIFAPDGDLVLNNATVLTHRISVTLPF